MESLGKSRDHIAEQIRLLKDAGVDFLILETFFHLAEMKVALECAAAANLPAVATMSFRPLISQCTDGHTPAECAKVMADLGAIAVGANCEQEPARIPKLEKAGQPKPRQQIPPTAERRPTNPFQTDRTQFPRHGSQLGSGKILPEEKKQDVRLGRKRRDQIADRGRKPTEEEHGDKTVRLAGGHAPTGKRHEGDHRQDDRGIRFPAVSGPA